MVDLQLTEEEAKTLVYVLRQVMGPWESRRADIDNIRNILEVALDDSGETLDFSAADYKSEGSFIFLNPKL